MPFTLDVLKVVCLQKDTCVVFGSSLEKLSILDNTLLNYIYHEFQHLLSNLNQQWPDHAHMQKYGAAIRCCGTPPQNVFSFIDRTLHAMCQSPTMSHITYYTAIRWAAEGSSWTVSQSVCICDKY